MTAKKSAAIRRLEGNRGHRPIEDELRGLGKPELPAHLTPLERERWQQIVSSLPDGLLSRADTQVLERMAISWSLFRETTEQIQKGDLLIRGREGAKIRNPLLIIRKQAAEEMQVCATALGLSPQARTRLSAPATEQQDPLELLMNGAFELQRGV